MAKSEEEFTNPANMFLSGNSQQEDTLQETGQATPQQDPGQADPQPQIPAGYRLVRETKSERLQLLVTPRIKEGIEAAAKREGTSTNNLINLILMHYLEGNNK